MLGTHFRAELVTFAQTIPNFTQLTKQERKMGPRRLIDE
jgi:hypothetical protein